MTSQRLIHRVKVLCDSANCKFSPNHPPTCTPPDCTKTCWQLCVFTPVITTVQLLTAPAPDVYLFVLFLSLDRQFADNIIPLSPLKSSVPRTILYVMLRRLAVWYNSSIRGSQPLTLTSCARNAARVAVKRITRCLWFHTFSSFLFFVLPRPKKKATTFNLT